MARRANDFYETPSWCVRRLLEDPNFQFTWGTPSGAVLEPCAGTGKIIQATQAFPYFARTWVANELLACNQALLEAGATVATTGDFLLDETQELIKRARAPLSITGIITNPPYKIAVPIIEKCFEICEGPVAMLLRLNFQSSAKRASFFKNRMPDTYVLPDRPNFVLSEKGSTSDMQEYAWFVWGDVHHRNKDYGTVRRLATTPRSERPKPTK